MILFDYNSNVYTWDRYSFRMSVQFQVESIYYICIIIYSIDMLSVIVTEQLNIC